MIAELVAGCLLLGLAEDSALVETLLDAQATHRENWSRGRAVVRVEIKRPEAEKPAEVDGEVAWLKDSFVLKFVVKDPDGVFFDSRGATYDLPWNFVARGQDYVVTYVARNHILHERANSPGSFLEFFDLTPITEFSSCCPPHASRGRAWRDMIGPSPSLPKAMADSIFTHKTLPNGDVEQTRVDKTGDKSVIVFGMKEAFAVVSLSHFNPKGDLTRTIKYNYSNYSGKFLYPASCEIEEYKSKDQLKVKYNFQYIIKQIGDGVAPLDFARESVLARIRAEGRGPQDAPDPRTGSNRSTSDEVLESMAKGLRKEGTAKP